ncbi:MAG: DNA polymerase III subunit gamma/tau [Pseudomonadota bacterium]
MTPASGDTDHSESAAAPVSGAAGAYEVLARKYRPQTFADLIGQEPMVRTLRNAFAGGRVAHAFILTGVRGVGKTTTARILARALTYEPSETEEDAEGEAAALAIDRDDPGKHGDAIAASRHPDVIEMDAASRTGINDIRELIDGVLYAPVQARYKIYIIDEVHMLSVQAFNGLLKTLEEPPPHVKFIFATTDIHKVPVTVLSRCQRFDLRRIEPEAMQTHLRSVATKEGVRIEDGALAMIARASEGSVRDALSLLDQALVQSGGGAGGGDEAVSTDAVRDMLGLADRSRTIALLDHLFKGDAGAALAEFRTQYDTGAEPKAVIRDLLDLTHWLTRLKVAGPEASGRGAAGEAEPQTLAAMAEKLSVAALSRVWSMTMGGWRETQTAPDPAQAAEMLLIRLAYAADLPTPDDLIKRLEAERGGAAATPASTSAQASAHQSVQANAAGGSPSGSGGAPASFGNGAGARGVALAAAEPSDIAQPMALAPAPTEPAQNPIPTPIGDDGALQTFEDLLRLVEVKRDVRLKTDLDCFVHLVAFEPGRITFRPAEGAPADLAARLGQRLAEWTGARWVISVDAHRDGAPTPRAAREAEVRADPLVQAALDAFPDAKIVAIRDGEDLKTRAALSQDEPPKGDI